MQTSERLLSLIKAQRTLLINKGYQTEILSAELTRLADSKQPYYVTIGVQAALKLLGAADEVGIHISKLLRSAEEKTTFNKRWELELYKSEMEEMRLRDAHRKEAVKLTASGYLLGIHTAIANRATENLCHAQVFIIAADGNSGRVGYLPSSDQLAAELAELKDLTMSFAHDMADYGETIDQYGRVNNDDDFEMRTRKEALHMIQGVTNSLMEASISQIGKSIHSLKSVDKIGDAHIKGHLEALSANGVAAATLAKLAVQMLNDALAGLHTVAVTAPSTRKTFTANAKCGDLTALIVKEANEHLN
jgi:hypothetical protein